MTITSVELTIALIAVRTLIIWTPPPINQLLLVSFNVGQLNHFRRRKIA